MEAGGSERLSRLKGGPTTEEGRVSGAKSFSEQTKGNGWEGIQDTEGGGK